jgi:hypothetical protein
MKWMQDFQAVGVEEARVGLFITLVKGNILTKSYQWFLMVIQALTACPPWFSTRTLALLLKPSLPNPTSFLSQHGHILVSYAVPPTFIVGRRARGPAVAILFACILWLAW